MQRLKSRFTRNLNLLLHFTFYTPAHTTTSIAFGRSMNSAWNWRFGENWSQSEYGIQRKARRLRRGDSRPSLLEVEVAASVLPCEPGLLAFGTLEDFEDLFGKDEVAKCLFQWEQEDGVLEPMD
jgi:hypothetical protein